ncbi:lysophospholipase NTE1 [Aulographum hederae CBS 113979]|uniref:Lysophospholipase NTE1 n=1 Tax=Aulographum hederae CBS 113979 TaxID=1176131 RepID=A0A6G1H262_9PEZI|nr:lysophospholipase NTE1 [Aulographum hederae CBS 113979]
MASLPSSSSVLDAILESATSSAQLPARTVAASSHSTFGLLGRVILSSLGFISALFYWIIRFTTITMPTFLFSLLSTSLTVTLNFTTLALMFLAFGSLLSWLVRYRYLNMYSRLPPEPQRNQPQIDVFPDTEGRDLKPGLSNYLDEFLSAIKVFGYLERPVFHELTRTMQTKKLLAGETLLLEEEKGFCLVVDGMVQIFVKSKREEKTEMGDSSGDDLDDSSGHNQGYQLLTEVRNGAPMSSMFSILSLFTENLQLRHDHDGDNGGHSSRPSTAETVNPVRTRDASPDFSTMSPAHTPQSPGQPSFSHRRTSSLASPTAGGRLPSIPHLSLEAEGKHTQEIPKTDRRRKSPAKSAHPDIVARATQDTTIAIIPATAFKRLTRVYPKATAHIVSVILTRLQRVTLATGHAYLGLTSEVLRTEKLMNKYTTYDLPGFLRDDALRRLKEKFAKERERIGEDDYTKGIALHNPGSARRRARRTTGPSLRRDTSVRVAVERMTPLGNPSMSSMPRKLSPGNLSERSGISAGDLLSNTHATRHRGRPGRLSFSQPMADSPGAHRRESQTPDPGYFNPGRMQVQRQDSSDEDSIFREAILECMCKAIGLTDIKNELPNSASHDQSPRLVSFDSRRQKAVFTNAFRLMEPYEPSMTADTESVASISPSVQSVSMDGHDPYNMMEELVNDVEIVFFPQGSVLVEQGERNPGLYYVIDGFLDVSVSVDEGNPDASGFVGSSNGEMSSSELFGSPPPLHRTPSQKASKKHDGGKRKKAPSRESLFLTKPGGIAGYLGTVSSYRSFVNVTAKTDVYVGFLPRASMERIVDKYPVVLLTMAKRLTSLLPRLILHIDFALEWVQVNAGQKIYEQGEPSDAIYIVLNGRLRAIREDGNDMRVIGEYGQGDSVGELEVLTESNRPGSLHAIRDTELAKFPKTLFNSLALEHPGITMKISKIIAKRMRSIMEDPLSDQTKERAAGTTRNPASTVNLRTVAILPVTAGIPVVEFGGRLVNALTQIGLPNGVVSLNQTSILNHLGRHAFNRMGKLKLSQYLADLEEKYGLVLYIADTNVQSPWTQTCINQADCILLVGLAESSPAIGEYERFLLTTKTTARKELVLLHAERYCPPGLTRKWLRSREWINGGHHHIQMAFRTSPEPVHPPNRKFGSALKQRVQVIQAEIQKYTSRKVRETPLYSAETPLKGDFHRLARRLCGKSVGIVLGGGGARGIAHVGIIRAMEEAGIPIDIVGGTSIGAFIGALYAWDADVVPTYGRAKKFAGRMASMWRFALDLTYPTASYTTGHEFNRGIFKTFGTSQIEDFWLDFYCNTTNISKSRTEYHTSGYVWRYVRASMSLAGLLPPLCDEGDMLLDGGYIDNLTVAHMKSLGADVIFAVDVGALDDDTPQMFGDTLSGFWALFNRWNPISSYPNPPALSEIQARLAYVSSVDALERAKTMPGCRYMRPDVEGYGTLEFGKFQELYHVGYAYGKEYLAKMKEEGMLPGMEESGEQKNLRRTMAPRRASI